MRFSMAEVVTVTPAARPTKKPASKSKLIAFAPETKAERRAVAITPIATHSNKI